MTTESEAHIGAPARHRVRFDVLALSGAVTTALAFAASAPESPDDPSAAGLREHLAEAAGAWQAYALLMACAAAVLVVFLAHLRGALVAASRSSGRGGVAVDAGFGAGLLVAAWLLVSAGCTAVVAFGDTAAYDDVSLVSLWGLGEAADMIGVAAFTVKGLAMASVGVAVLRTCVLGAWLGWLSIALGLITWVALFVPAMFYAGIFAFPLWPLAVSIALVVRGFGKRSVPDSAI